MDSLKIGIITIGIGLLSLIYPLTHIYLINLLRDLDAAWICIIKKCKSEKCQNNYRKIINFQSTVSYIVNIFFLTGILFLAIFVILLFQHVEGVNLVLIIRIFIVLAIIFSLLISFWRKEVTEKKMTLKWAVFIVTAIGFLYLLCFHPLKCDNQLFYVLLWLGALMIFQIFVWYWAGILFRPTEELKMLREEIYKKIYEEWRAKESKKNEEKHADDSAN